MTGAVPNTQWLQGCVALDDKGFVKTGIGSARRRSGRGAAGPCRARRTCWRRVFPACSRWATCAPTASSALRLPSARVRSAFSSCIGAARDVGFVAAKSRDLRYRQGGVIEDLGMSDVTQTKVTYEASATAPPTQITKARGTGSWKKRQVRLSR